MLMRRRLIGPAPNFSRPGVRKDPVQDQHIFSFLSGITESMALGPDGLVSTAGPGVGRWRSGGTARWAAA
jgi:hypothetical protein